MMIKKVEDWTFSEHQTHAKGVLEGILIGGFLASSFLMMGLHLLGILK
jgi:hypothetical protein